MRHYTTLTYAERVRRGATQRTITRLLAEMEEKRAKVQEFNDWLAREAAKHRPSVPGGAVAAGGAMPVIDEDG